ncbi:MAG: hypothetical protein HMLKMBBP_03496 [Planctomycetes bacterium]|nr:hypothetical protein [Planctomycetota bacterium]
MSDLSLVPKRVHGSGTIQVIQDCHQAHTRNRECVASARNCYNEGSPPGIHVSWNRKFQFIVNLWTNHSTTTQLYVRQELTRTNSWRLVRDGRDTSGKWTEFRIEYFRVNMTSGHCPEKDRHFVSLPWCYAPDEQGPICSLRTEAEAMLTVVAVELRKGEPPGRRLNYLIEELVIRGRTPGLGPTIVPAEIPAIGPDGQPIRFEGTRPDPDYESREYRYVDDIDHCPCGGRTTGPVAAVRPLPAAAAFAAAWQHRPPATAWQARGWPPARWRPASWVERRVRDVGLTRTDES